MVIFRCHSNHSWLTLTLFFPQRNSLQINPILHWSREWVQSLFSYLTDTGWELFLSQTLLIMIPSKLIFLIMYLSCIFVFFFFDKDKMVKFIYQKHLFTVLWTFSQSFELNRTDELMKIISLTHFTVSLLWLLKELQHVN